MSWQLISIHSQRIQHVLPVADSLPHQEDVYCFCFPRVEYTCDNWVQIVHNSHDGREKLERLAVVGIKLKRQWDC